MLVIHSTNAPDAIGPYSQAIKHNDVVYLSGQIPLDPDTMQIISTDIKEQVQQVFKNLQAVCIAAGGDLNKIIKLNIYLTSLENFSIVNEIMVQYFAAPYPARAVIGINELPKAALVEMDAVMMI